VDDLPISGPFNLQGQSGLYDANEFNLTLNDGRLFLVSVTKGLESITDLYGHLISFTSTNISIANVATPTQQTNIVVFQRNAQNLITNIYITAVGSNNAVRYIYSTGNINPLDLSLVIDRGGNTNTFIYDGQDDLTDIIAPTGAHAIKNTYYSIADGASVAGRLKQTSDELGHTTMYTYVPDANYETITDPLGNEADIYYDANGNVTTQTQYLNGLPVVTVC